MAKSQLSKCTAIVSTIHKVIFYGGLDDVSRRVKIEADKLFPESK